MDRRVVDVARFEFRRFLDVKGELIGIAVLALIALIRFGGEALITLSTPDNLTIVVESVEQGVFPAASSGRFNFVVADPAAHVQSLERVRNGSVSGLLVPESPTQYRLYSKDRVYWQAALSDSFAPYHRLLGATRANVSAADLQAITAHPNVVSDPLQGEAAIADLATYAASITIMVLSILGIISAQSIILQGIAGEKFGRISEIVLSAISPALWIDGKLIAASLHGLKTIVAYTLYGVVAALLLEILTPVQLLGVIRAWPQLVSALVIGVVGLIFWSVTAALVAALLSSATSPIRNTLILVPMTCLLLCLGGAKEPDNAFMVALSYLPPTMPFAMPIRIVSDTAAVWEVALAMGLVGAATLLMRAQVVRVFTAAVLGAGRTSMASAAR